MLATIESKQRIDNVHSFNSSVVMNIFIVKSSGEIIKMKTLNLILRDKSYSESLWTPNWELFIWLIYLLTFQSINSKVMEYPQTVRNKLSAPHIKIQRLKGRSLSRMPTITSSFLENTSKNIYTHMSACPTGEI